MGNAFSGSGGLAVDVTTAVLQQLSIRRQSDLGEKREVGWVLAEGVDVRKEGVGTTLGDRRQSFGAFGDAYRLSKSRGDPDREEGRFP